MKTKTKASPSLKPLSAEEQVRLRVLWDQRLRDSHAMIPRKARAGGITATEARMSNALLGKFADSYMKLVLRRMQVIHRNRKCKQEKIVLAVGYGRGDGSRWLRQASMAGYKTIWVDVSVVAGLWATTSLRRQFQAIPQSPSVVCPEPRVWTTEIQSLLAEPHKLELHLGKVKIWYLCRLLNCLSTTSAKVVLQEIGRTALRFGPNSSKRGAVIVINALSDHNSDCSYVCGTTSIVRSKKMILANLARGAGRPVEARFVKYHDFLGKLVTAMTVMAK